MAKKLGRLLVVDDDENLIEVISMRLESAHYEVVAIVNEEEAIETIKEKTFDLAILDLQLTNRDGISLMEEIHKVNPELPVIILTAYGSIESAVDAMKRGAFSYLTKPFDPRELLFQVEKALNNRRLFSEIKRLQGLLEEKYDFENIIAKSEKMQRVLEKVSVIAGTDSTIQRGKTLRLWLSTVRRFLKLCLRASFSDMKRALLRVQCAILMDFLHRLIKGPYFWMRSAICRFPFRPRCCVYFRRGSFILWVVNLL
jgi:DNA-binding response OmpR family regulator